MSIEPSRPAQAGRVFALLVSNAIKLGGLYVAVRTVASATPNALAVGLAAFMMAGAQVSEDTVMGLVERMFGGHREGQEPKK